MISDSTVSYDERDQAMRCSACFETMHVSRAVLAEPDRFIEMLELAQLDHANCKNYRGGRRLSEVSRTTPARRPDNRAVLVKNHPIGRA